MTPPELDYFARLFGIVPAMSSTEAGAGEP